MIARPHIARLGLAAALLASVSLAACGKLGELEQPAPLFGDKAKADYAAQHHAADAARARAAAAKSVPAEQNSNTADPSPLPLHQAPYAPPIPGRTDPNGPNGVPTALPQPGQPSADQ
jgi:predicted small lipoprotein YifL